MFIYIIFPTVVHVNMHLSCKIPQIFPLKLKTVLLLKLKFLVLNVGNVEFEVPKRRPCVPY